MESQQKNEFTSDEHKSIVFQVHSGSKSDRELRDVLVRTSEACLQNIKSGKRTMIAKLASKEIVQVCASLLSCLQFSQIIQAKGSYEGDDTAFSNQVRQYVAENYSSKYNLNADDFKDINALSAQFIYMRKLDTTPAKKKALPLVLHTRQAMDGDTESDSESDSDDLEDDPGTAAEAPNTFEADQQSEGDDSDSST